MRTSLEIRVPCLLTKGDKMQRFHINLTVSDLDRSIGFYTTLFGSEPSRRESDYAKWMLEDPRVNFAISTHGATPGIDHVGLQAEDEDGLADIRSRLERADAPILDQEDVNCCYAQSTKGLDQGSGRDRMGDLSVAR